jgi:DNA gyrase subunit B
MASTAASEAMQEKRVAGEYTAANVQVILAARGGFWCPLLAC